MDNLEITLENLKEYITDLFKDEQSGHDITHLINVLDFAREIQSKEGGDEYVICISALLHDFHRLMSTKDRYVTPEESLPRITEILNKFNIDKKEEILYCIANHEKKQNKDKFNLETLILQDADILDALGQRGLDRTIKYCTTHKIPLVNTLYPLDSTEYIPDVNPLSACHYIHRTLIPNCENLNTTTATQLALESTQILRDFINEQYRGSEL